MYAKYIKELYVWYDGRAKLRCALNNGWSIKRDLVSLNSAVGSAQPLPTAFLSLPRNGKVKGKPLWMRTYSPRSTVKLSS